MLLPQLRFILSCGNNLLELPPLTATEALKCERHDLLKSQGPLLPSAAAISRGRGQPGQLSARAAGTVH